MPIYKPAKGARYNEQQAKRLGTVLEKIGFTATPKQIVDAARPIDSPIHDLFEWDDTAAAEAYRLFQARNHTNHLQVVIKTDKGDVETRAFHSVVIKIDDDDNRAYCSVENIAEDQALADQVIAKALSELNGWRMRYSQYKMIFGGVFQAIEKIQDTRRRISKSRRKKGKVRAA